MLNIIYNRAIQGLYNLQLGDYSVVTIKAKVSETIFRAKNYLLYNEWEPWIKKQSNHFDVTMRSCDGPEVCELTGIFILSLIGNKYKPNMKLYRDDGLAVFKNTSGPQLAVFKNTSGPQSEKIKDLKNI